MLTNHVELRRIAINQAFPALQSLPVTMRRLGFVQADPIRAPATAQDLILRHRVRNYRVGDLEQRYPKLDLEEGFLYAYGFASQDVAKLLPRKTSPRLKRFHFDILEEVRENGESDSKCLEERFGRTRVKNAWGGFSRATKDALETLHKYGQLRVSRRRNGVRVYEVAKWDKLNLTADERSERMVEVLVGIFAPISSRLLQAHLSQLYRRWNTPQSQRHDVRWFVQSGMLEPMENDETTYVRLASQRYRREPQEDVKLLAPFDPLVWDRARFSHFWNWEYRFEAYTPKSKRVRGYYALPLLYRDEMVGWGNIVSKPSFDVQLGFVRTRPRERAFRSALDDELQKVESFLQPRR